MKSIKTYTALTIMAMVFCTSLIFAQANNKNEVPANVQAAFTAKYPNAQVKDWEAVNEQFTAKAKEAGHKYFATFDKNGNWVNTVTKYNWPGHLSPPVKEAFKKSEYSGWHIYAINIVESPAGQVYQVMVDDANHKINANHQELFTVNHTIEFKQDGNQVKQNIIN
ncbi:PepSY-like domain-containing protein [Mucilaginibacter gotjawali]|uniref:Putative beta-lactamase-inhibitor-like PepSY-like domain-containing protein n=2 Tax=Mucilaginibacter gotjawali TaxID=1550579 RepID=A0A839SGW0_9SPHI|nr:PepSY-like domain-containing protein [Mucilaginibacter gotjawali]MBB3055767.1 hypothetical protein [Mucilaginibacter gotjawali]